MVREKLAIVSSFDDFCGNASYTKALAKGLDAHFDVTPISLDVNLLQRGESKNIQKYIKSLCKQLEQFDCVNIQFEAGLFGLHEAVIKKNFFLIAKSSKRLVLTMHQIQGRQSYPSLCKFAQSLLQLKLNSFLKTFYQNYLSNRRSNLYNDVIRFCKRNKIPIIVHTQRDRKFIRLKFDYDCVFDHPLCFYNQEDLHSFNSFSKSDFCKKLSLNQNSIHLGIFGFINNYKDHLTAIRALKHLPQNYELLIFGSQHPQSIKFLQEIDPYIDKLLIQIKKMKLTKRVKFLRLSNDDDFLRALFCCDFNILPYLEVNQGGSGIASLTLETNSNAIFSQNLAFFELAKYAPNAFKMFSIGNHLELANAILSYQKSDYETHLKEYHKKYNLSTNAHLYKHLLKRSPK